MKFSGDSTEYAEFVTNFRDNIESQVTDDSQRLTRLLAQCVGKAREAIRSCVNLPLGQRYSVAWKTLRENFGQPHMVADACVKRLKDIQLRKADAPTLMDFARQLEDANRVLTSMGPQYANRLGNEDVIVMLMRKLPEESLKRKWTDRAGDIIKTEGQVKYSDFVEFIRKCAHRLNNRFGQELKSSSGRDRSSRPDQSQQKVTTLATRSNLPVFKDTRPIKCPQCSGAHGVWRCQAFKSASLADRLKVMRRHKLCRRCLGEGHFAKSCERNFTCRKPGCGQDHHSLLHPRDGDSGRSRSSDGDSNPSVSTSNGNPAGGPSRADPERSVIPDGPNAASSSAVAMSSSSVLVGAVRTGKPRVCFKVVPVTVSGPDSGRKITTCAFLDSGSDTTLCLRSLAEDLGLTRTATSFTIATVNYEGNEHGHEVQLNVEALSGGESFHLDHVLTTESLPVTSRHFATNAELKKWPHLDGITLPEIEDKKVSLLIGSDRPDIIESALEVRKGKKGQPFAVKTPLGWTVHGPMGQAVANEACVNFVRSEQEMMISAQLERMYNAEFSDPLLDVEQSMSVEDRKAKAIMDKSAHLVNGHYSLKLPFRRDPPDLPDSLPVAKKRLDYLRRKMDKDPVFHQQYSAVMEKYQDEGSSRLVPAEEVATLSPIWYLPHHAVWHPRKPNEPRVVFDCASKSRGTSLNEQLLQGPDNTSTLIGVILRFRVNEVAVAADIKRMFHQVFVAPEDRGALCYLWWPGGDLKKEPQTHQMLVHIFGATSSPSVAGYALRRTARDNEQDFSEETVDAVFKDFYVDDLLKSFIDTGQAIDITKQLQELMARGGFQLTKVISNDRKVLSEFPTEERAPAVKNLDLKSDDLPMDKALGIHWNVEEDTFDLVVSGKDQPENRKGILSSIATVHDPLGFASPLLLPGREINQELCRRKYDWNEDLPPDLLRRWREWQEGLVNLRGYGIPRCFKPRSFGEIVRVELHHFADASEEHGYGTASYIRFINAEGQIHNSFVLGKSRVRPLRSGVTVPKFELTAATLLVQMNKLIEKELRGRLKIDSVTFWTDSVIVLRYIFNETKRFVTFVANRVAIIREGSNPCQWRHVRSEINPADHASRGIKAWESEKLEMWRRGPDFLWKDEREWPPQPTDLRVELSDGEEGVKKVKVVASTTIVEKDFWNSLFHRFSTWIKLQKTVAWLIRACRMFQKHSQSKKRIREERCCQRTEPLSVSELSDAGKRIIKFVQRESFPEEFNRDPSKVDRSKGQLGKLKPFLQEGLLRVGGRLDRSDLNYDAKHPMILPGRHRVAEMIILHYHHSNGHVGSHQVLAETRQRFWIVKGVSSVRQVLRRCHECRRQSAKLGEQVTAPLPAVRVSSDHHRLIYPFAAIGIDYFGPLHVSKGPATRSSKKGPLNKRYGCIFTCLRYRAVHIEVASDLSTDSFINAFTRFVGRRGPPRVVYSDNGTNFRGANQDVLKALKEWNQEKIRDDLHSSGIQWNFNPPAASHQGGVWERLIRSVRRILHSMVGERLVNEETLITFLVEVEKIMNSRPITPVSQDPSDLDALTPNHILLLRQNPSSAPDEFQDPDQYRARWKHVHLLANDFWRRWMKEYLPTLQERQKWLHQKPNFKAGDLVLVADRNTPRGQWPKALIERTFPDNDGIVRRVIVRTADGVYQRDVRKLCLLEEELLKSIEEQSSTPKSDHSLLDARGEQSQLADSA